MMSTDSRKYRLAHRGKTDDQTAMVAAAMSIFQERFYRDDFCEEQKNHSSGTNTP